MQMTFLLLYIVLAPWMWFETGTQANNIISIQNLWNWNCPDIIWWFIFFILSFFMYSWGWGGGPLGPPFHIWPLRSLRIFLFQRRTVRLFFSAMDGIRQKHKIGNSEGVREGQKCFQQGIFNNGKHDYLSFYEKFKSQCLDKTAYMQPQLSRKRILRAYISQ